MDISRERLSLSVPGTVDHLARIREFVTVNARSAGFSEGDVDDIVLALDEAVANIVEHAYEGSDLPDREKSIRLTIECDGKLFRVLLQDHGIPYDPTAAAELTPEESRRKGERGDDGGWGLYMIRQLMDEISYSYDPESGNSLEIIKRLQSGS